MRWDEVKELAPLYAIGALDAETARAIEASLTEATPDQRHEIDHWREVVALLSQALPQKSPPDRLKQRLFDRIAREAQETPIETAIAEFTEKDSEQAEGKVLL